MKEKFVDWKPKGQTLELLDKIMSVVDAYQKAGYKMTLRQLYYQLVSADLIPNTDPEYKKLGEILKRGRLAGMVDWDAIEDRMREPKRKSQWDSIPDLMESALKQFRMPRTKDQPYHIELWTEKDALTSVLKPITERYHVYLMVNRGYSSASAMYEAYERFDDYRDKGKQIVILYLGDHDPSGLDMDRDIYDRLNYTFGTEIIYGGPENEDGEPGRIGLTKSQIKKFGPPPNPAKITDSRAREYIRKHGKMSWEVDALKPNELDKIVSNAIEQWMDMDKYNRWIEREKPEKQKLRELIDNDDNEWDLSEIEDEE